MIKIRIEVARFKANIIGSESFPKISNLDRDSMCIENCNLVILILIDNFLNFTKNSLNFFERLFFFLKGTFNACTKTNGNLMTLILLI